MDQAGRSVQLDQQVVIGSDQIELIFTLKHMVMPQLGMTDDEAPNSLPLVEPDPHGRH